MSTIDRDHLQTLPPLVDGERLDRATFHERYGAMPPGTRAELVGGVTVMSPAGKDHGDIVLLLANWLGGFARNVPGIRASMASTILLDDISEPEPDLHLRVLPEYGGTTRVEGAYIVGAPELVIEVSRSTRARDLGPKRSDYERGGVLEYLVVALDPNEVYWFARRNGRLQAMTADADGLYRSESFPGLCLDPRALFGEDLGALLATIELGRATPEHAAFVANLAARRSGC